ncbi:plastid-lipid-associated protein 11 [Seminavis robusta]|uniref:Plastid-lipid-associated protein 11 n=1 Tax=Seminavis robusta TaxID=568900 RepID=A0A9N8HA97_9STRA|nr:plastid-lipid-associated protein 11 [Seminavis robusta]|eukprot:Sro234_g094460.1 plastid-lipid-associated protein 11 (238) ;mRNA; f:49464-50177
MTKTCGSFRYSACLFLLWQCLFQHAALAFMTPGISPSPSGQDKALFMIKFPKAFESFLPSPPTQPQSNEVKDKREELKATLLDACKNSNSNKQEQRAEIETVIEQLKELCPTSPATAASPLLQKKWALVWTTEKEINFFLDVGFSNEIGQTIAGEALDNNIEFIRGGGFYVSGKLSIPDSEGPRTDFEFETAKLDLGKWGKFQFPPVGAGWFDTVYLDDTLRVDLNSRDDILICTPY